MSRGPVEDVGDVEADTMVLRRKPLLVVMDRQLQRGRDRNVGGVKGQLKSRNVLRPDEVSVGAGDGLKRRNDDALREKRGKPPFARIARNPEEQAYSSPCEVVC